jgi:glycerophosphoryl diester phosphodiesterase
VRFTRHSEAEVVAHRGASAYAPEHTLAAYDLAVDQGADALELDLRATRDGEVVVVHDPTLLRTHGDPRSVSSVRLRDLAPGRRPLTLASVLARYGGRVGLLLELKGPGAPVDAVVAQLRAAATMDRIVLQSFDVGALRRAAILDRALPVARLFARRPTNAQLDRAAAGFCGVGVPHETVDPALLHAARSRGLVVRAFTANTATDLRRLARCGVDGVITDRPDLAREAVGLPVSVAA